MSGCVLPAAVPVVCAIGTECSSKCLAPYASSALPGCLEGISRAPAHHMYDVQRAIHLYANCHSSLCDGSHSLFHLSSSRRGDFNQRPCAFSFFSILFTLFIKKILTSLFKGFKGKSKLTTQYSKLSVNSILIIIICKTCFGKKRREKIKRNCAVLCHTHVGECKMHCLCG